MEKLSMEHPGVLLREEFLEPLGLSVAALARGLGLTRARVGEVVRGVRGISVDTALRLSLFFGTSAEFWLNLQKQYDLARAREETLPNLRRIVRPLEEAPA
jgi:antitoxin HigA-1